MRGVGPLLRFVLFEPARNIQHLGDVVAGAAGDAVGLFGNANEDSIHVEEFERFVELLSFGNGSAIVGFTGHDQCGRLDFGDEIGEGALHIIIGVLPGKTREPVLGDEWNVGSEREAVPIDDGIESSRGAETISVLDGPAGENTTAASAGDEEIVGVNVAFGNDGVDAAVEIGIIVARISVMDEISKFFAVARATSRIGVENHVATRGQDLLFEIETVAIVGERAAVNLKNKGIFLRRIKIRGVDDPTLNLTIVFR